MWLTCLLTSWSRVLLERLPGFAASQEIPRIYGTRKFITVLTIARHLSLSWARSIQSPTTPYHFLKIHLYIILPSTSGSPQWSLSLRLPHQHPVHISPLPHTLHMPSHLILLDFTTRTILGKEYRSLSSLCNFLHSPVTSSQHCGYKFKITMWQIWLLWKKMI
jgi:hypothetical protein